MQVKTFNYSDTFKLIQSLAGVNSFTSEEQSDIGRFMNRRFFTAFNESPNWARYLIPSEERYLQSDKYTITFSVTGSTTTSNIETHDFLWVGMYNNTPVFATVDTVADEFDGNNGYYICYKAPIDDPLSTPGEWIITRGLLSDLDTANPQSNIISTVTSNLSLYNSRTINDYNAGANVPQALKEPAYPNLVLDLNLGGWNKSSTQGSVTNVTVKATGNMLIPYREVYTFTNVSTFSPLQKDTIGEYIRIYRKKALQRNSAIEYNFYVDEQGAHIINPVDSSDTSAFVTYKQQFEPFTTTSSFTTSTEAVPEEFHAYIAHASYADFLRMDGQHQKALLEEQTAKGALDLQLERNDIIANNNNATTRFQTYVNSQSR
jgi:hypothetical protein